MFPIVGKEIAPILRMFVPVCQLKVVLVCHDPTESFFCSMMPKERRKKCLKFVRLSRFCCRIRIIRLRCAPCIMLHYHAASSLFERVKERAPSSSKVSEVQALVPQPPGPWRLWTGLLEQVVLTARVIPKRLKGNPCQNNILGLLHCYRSRLRLALRWLEPYTSKRMYNIYIYINSTNLGMAKTGHLN